MSSLADRSAAGFRLEMQEVACMSKPFPSRRKIALPNGIMIWTRWYSVPKVERRCAPLIPDVRLPNGIVLRAASYRNPSWTVMLGHYRTREYLRSIEAAYHAWKAMRDAALAAPPKHSKDSASRIEENR